MSSNASRWVQKIYPRNLGLRYQLYPCFASLKKHAIYRKSKADPEIKRDHWLDYADDKYDSMLRNDIKTSSQALKVFLAFPVFWAIAVQVGSRWTFQATRMDGIIGSFLVKPDQMQIIDPLLVLILVPAFDIYIYPKLANVKGFRTPLEKLTTSGMVGAVAFIFSALLELQLEV